MYVAPNSVSGRVVNTSMTPSPAWNVTSAPSLRPDPVRLRLLRDLRPVDRFEVAEEPLREPRDLEEPLGQAPLLDGRLAAFAEPGDDLLVGEHRQARGAPVDRRLTAFDQPALEELEEHPLRPAVVRRVGGVHRVVPVVHAAEALQLAREVGDVPRDEFVRVGPYLEGVVLRVDAERVEAHGLEHVLAAQPPVPAVRVRADVRVHVPDVQPLRGGVREHHEVVVGVLRGPEVFVGEEIGAAPVPLLLPLALDALGVVAVRPGAHRILPEGEKAAYRITKGRAAEPRSSSAHSSQGRRYANGSSAVARSRWPRPVTGSRVPSRSGST